MKAQRLCQGKNRVDWSQTQLRELAWEVGTEKPPAHSISFLLRDIVLKVFNIDSVDSSGIGGDSSQTSQREQKPM